MYIPVRFSALLLHRLPLLSVISCIVSAVDVRAISIMKAAAKAGIFTFV